MNERIRELAEQAGCSIDGMGFGEGDVEGLAELIVRECMDICKQHPSRILSNNWNADAVTPDIVHRFEEHFGVEE